MSGSRVPPSGEGTSPRLIVCPADRLHKLNLRPCVSFRRNPDRLGRGRWHGATLGGFWRPGDPHSPRPPRPRPPTVSSESGKQICKMSLSRIIDSLATKTLVLDGRLVGKERKKPVPEGPAQTMALPQTVAAFRVQALERSRFAVGRLPAAYGDWSARPLACRSEGNGVRWVWNCLAELTTRVVSALRPSIAVARGDRATVGTRDFPSSPPMGDSFWLGL